MQVSYTNHMRPTAIYTLVISALLLIEPLALRSDFSSFGTWLWFSLGIVGIVVFVIDKRRK